MPKNRTVAFLGNLGLSLWGKKQSVMKKGETNDASPLLLSPDRALRSLPSVALSSQWARKIYLAFLEMTSGHFVP
jgi:hypothetical protein